ncbi:MAG: hypothetical protein DMG11_12540 [Acidobacteria bacterium]|nr:MAG: hypothetical protein DMG11_12540 [Acidobacteriota bacterium]
MSYLPEVFERAVEAHRSRVALVEESKQWTFAELLDEANRVAALVRERVKGDAVGILLLNSQRYIATMLGVWKAGKTVVPLNYLLPPGELGFIVKDSGMSAIISSQFFAQSLAALKPLFGDRGVILMADDPGFTAMSPGGIPAEYRDPALYLYTSGTTGRPKGVILTHDNLAANVESCQKADKFDHNDAFLCLLPFFHTYAITGTFGFSR